MANAVLACDPNRPRCATPADSSRSEAAAAVRNEMTQVVDRVDPTYSASTGQSGGPVEVPSPAPSWRKWLDRLRAESPGLFNAIRSASYGALQLAAWARGQVLRRAQWRRYASTHPTMRNLHIGCGANRLPGWFNTDGGVISKDVAYLNATRRLPFEDGSLRYIFTEHMIEHISFAAGLRLMKECFRVLEPGGKLRISTPDLDKLIALNQGDLSGVEQAYVDYIISIMPGAVGRHAAYAINGAVRFWGHTFIYDRKVLNAALAEAGFTEIVVREPGESDDPELRGVEHHGAMYPDPRFNNIESIVVEATKPSVGRS